MSYIDKDGYKRLHWNLTEHKQIVERALKRKLPFGVIIHHIDGDKTNNHNKNLVVCPDHFYHTLLHIRTKALNECGNADWRRCDLCKTYDDVINLSHGGARRGYRHPACNRRKALDNYYKRKVKSE